MAFKGRGGGNRRGNNKRGGKGSGAEYTYSSSFTVNLCGDSMDKEPIHVANLIESIDESGDVQSLELNITLTADKADRFIELLQAAQEDPEGDGGIRLSMYVKEGENPDTGEVFDSMSILTMGKFPPKNKGRGSRGSFRGKGGGGRRDYDEPKRGRGRARDEEDDQEEENTTRSYSSKRGRSEDTQGTSKRRGRQSEPKEEEEEMEEVKSPYKKSRGKKGDDADDADVPF